MSLGLFNVYTVEDDIPKTSNFIMTNYIVCAYKDHQCICHHYSVTWSGRRDGDRRLGPLLIRPLKESRIIGIWWVKKNIFIKHNNAFRVQLLWLLLSIDQ